MVENWLITGGCGFVGGALIKKLLEDKLAKRIRVLDNLSVGNRESLLAVCDFIEVDYRELSSASSSGKGSVELVVGDIRDPETANMSCRGMDVVVHLAANTGVPASVENPRLDMESNVIGTFNMLEAARSNKTRRFVFASSGAPAGEVEPPIHEEMAPHPVSPYGASKLAGEGYCSSYFRTFGIDTVSLRFSNVYGPGSNHKTSVVAKFINQALKNEAMIVYGDGTQTRDFIYIDDLINALILSATRDGDGGETFQIATGLETTVGELAEILLKILTEKTGHMPELIYAAPRLGDVKRNYSDTTKAREILNWTCKWSLEDGLNNTIDWFLNSIEK